MLTIASTLVGCGANRRPDQQPRPGCQASVRSALAALPGLAAPVHSHLVSGDSETAICAYQAGRERLTVDVDDLDDLDADGHRGCRWRTGGRDADGS
jgi:hypothetical protein